MCLNKKIYNVYCIKITLKYCWKCSLYLAQMLSIHQ